MVRRKPDEAGDGERSITVDSLAKMLEVYAVTILGLAARSAVLGMIGPGSLSRTGTIDLDMKERIEGKLAAEKFSLDKLNKELRRLS
jgi:hypothetical protein